MWTEQSPGWKTRHRQKDNIKMDLRKDASSRI
jgi:hypothetical protein